MQSKSPVTLGLFLGPLPKGLDSILTFEILLARRRSTMPSVFGCRRKAHQIRRAK
jgi:hypothetical protein